MSEYTRPDPRSLGVYYTRHMDAMTGERLDDKSDIAAELAVRDKEIDQLRNIVFGIKAVLDREGWD